MAKKRKQFLITAGIVAVVAFFGVFYVVTLFGNTSTSVTLTQSGSTCTVSKEDKIRVKKNKNVRWNVTNACTAQQTFTLGNFHQPADPSLPDCGQGSDWPFKDGDQGQVLTLGPGASDKIVLHGAKNTTGSPLRYDYDVCVGGKKADPQIMIDP